MKQFLHSICVPDQAIGADGIFTFDLPVNPLSVVLHQLRYLNDTGTLANVPSWLNAAAALNRVSIMFRGESIVSARGEDLQALAWLRHGCMPGRANEDNVDNERVMHTIPIFMGRHAYDSETCFPASRKGELVLELDIDIADTGYDNMRFSVETVELLGARPKYIEKKVTNNQTFAAVGDNDMDLPPGNQCRGILLWGTTGFAGATPAPSWGRIKTMLDGREFGYSAIEFESAAVMGTMWGRGPTLIDHKHTLNAAGAGIEETTSVFDVGGVDAWNRYGWLDFDPTRDDEFTLDVSKASRFHLRATAETADAVRAIPIELIPANRGYSNAA